MFRNINLSIREARKDDIHSNYIIHTYTVQSVATLAEVIYVFSFVIISEGNVDL